MTTEYNYSISNDFDPAGINISQLQNEIIAEVLITVAISHIYTNDDDLYIVFPSALSVGEKTELDTIISNHISDNTIPPPLFFKINATEKSYTKISSYEMLISLTTPGENENEISDIKILSKVSKNDGSTYSVRIYDVTNNKVIAEQTFTNNTELQIRNMGTLSNLPNTEAIIEIHAKRNGGANSTRVYIMECTISY